MAANSRKCDHCGRLISKWVSELGYTLGHRDRNYCRFCYVGLRGKGEVHPKADDSEFLAAINWELDLIEHKKKGAGARQRGACPACLSKLSFNLRGLAQAEGVCPKCGAHIQILKSGAVKLVPTRTSIILNVARHMGERPDSIQQMYSYLLDEIGARLAEHPIVGIPELGTFRVRRSGGNVSIEFKPSRQLTSRIAKKGKSV